MYLMCLLLLLLAFSSATAQFCPGSLKQQNRHARSQFTTISNNIITHDHDIYETCKHFTAIAARQVWGKNAFRLEVLMPGMENAVWDVKIKHRVIYINGHLPRDPSVGCDLTYGDIKILPNFAETHRAAWKYGNGMFLVAMPYLFDMSAHTCSCSWGIDETLITVRRGFPDEAIFS